MGIDVHTMAPQEQIFTWVDPVTERSITFAVDRLAQELVTLKVQPFLVELPEGYWRFLVANRGVDPDYAEDLSDDERAVPAIAAQMPDGTHLLIDGTHRAYVESRYGGGLLLAYLVAPSIWQDFVVDGLPNITSDQLL